MKLKDALCLYANDNTNFSISPSSEEWKAMEQCVTVLKPFEEATCSLSSSDSLISSVIPIIYTLKISLEETKIPAEGDAVGNIVMNFIQAIKSEINKKFSNLENDNLFTILTFLHDTSTN